MGKVRKNEAGFSALEVVLVLVIVSLISAVGFMAYENQHKTKTASFATATTTKPATQIPAQTTTPAPTDPYAGWKTFAANAGNLTLMYPSDWMITDRTSVSYED